MLVDDDEEFRIVNRNGDTIAVTSTNALDEEFGSDIDIEVLKMELTTEQLITLNGELLRRLATNQQGEL